MSLTFCYWAAYPNRHLDPFLDEALRRGALRHVVYGAGRTAWQLGTSPARRAPELETIAADEERWRDRARSVLRSRCDFHLFYGVGHPVLHHAMNTCARLGIPYLFAGETLEPRRWLEPRRLGRELLFRWLLRGAASVFVVGTRAAADFARFGFAPDALFPFMYPGPRPAEPGGRRVEPPELVYVGRLIEAKGLDVLADALLLLRGRGVTLPLSVAGAGPYDAPLARAAAAGIPVQRHGAVPSARVAELIGRASALVLPTKRREGWGYVVNEAIAGGVPVVVSDLVGARELVVPGRTGHVFATRRADALADAIVATLALRRDEAALARAMAEARGALDAGPFTSYFLEAARVALAGGGPVEWPPWLAAAERLGGNPETRWWRSWRSWSPAGAAARGGASR